MYAEDNRMADLLPKLIRSDDVCVDVGAHLGSMLAAFCKCAPNGAHIAFEPVPRKANWLRKKFSGVRVIEAATSDTAGTATFFDDVQRPGYSGLRRPADAKEVVSFDVQLVRLDEQLADVERLDFLKVDVEGAELATVRGAEQLLATHRPIVLFECGVEESVEAFGHTRRDLFDFFDERNYDVFSIARYVRDEAPMTGDDFVEAGTYPFPGFNYLAFPSPGTVSD